MELRGDKKYVAFASGQNSGVRDLKGAKDWAASHLVKGNLNEVPICEVVAIARLPTPNLIMEPPNYVSVINE